MVLSFRRLPVKEVEDDYRRTAKCVAFAQTTLVLAACGWHLNAMLGGGPVLAASETSHWGPMPLLTVCIDDSSQSTMLLSVAFVVQGFGADSGQNLLAAACQGSGLRADPSRWIEGAELPGSRGSCHFFNLSRLAPFHNGSAVNNVAIGGIAAHPGSGDSYPKFASVCADASRPCSPDSSLARPLLFLPPQPLKTGWFGRYDVDSRLQISSYQLVKELVPAPLPRTNLAAQASLPGWLRRLLGLTCWRRWWDSPQQEQFEVRDMGTWSTCLPFTLLPARLLAKFQGLDFRDSVGFGAGIFVTDPTVRSVRAEGMARQLLALLAQVGGWCGVSFVVWRCLFVRPKNARWREDEEKRTLHPCVARLCCCGGGRATDELGDPLLIREKSDTEVGDELG